MRLTVESVLHPVGTLPPRVYWKRRLAGLAVVLLLILVPTLLLTQGGGRSQASDGDAPATSPATEADAPQLDLVPAETLTSTTAPPATSAPTSGAPGTTPTGSATPTSAPPPPQVPACSDAAVAVTAGSTRPQWRTDATPVFTMTVTNAGTTPCRRDLGASQQEWGLFDGATRLWGSNDCLFEPGQNVVTLTPGQQVTVQVTWSGLTSEPTCQQPRERLAGGEYQLRARNGKVQSSDVVVVLR